MKIERENTEGKTKDAVVLCGMHLGVIRLAVQTLPNQPTNHPTKMKRDASKRDERHGRSRHRPTKVLEFIELILRPERSHQKEGLVQ